jgi:hypothetical protein
MKKLLPFAAASLFVLSAAPALAADDLAKYQEESRKAAQGFMQQLGGELKKEISANGPESAIKVCKTLAPAIANELSNKNGWKVARVSLKPRNPLLGAADAWEQKVLADFDQRAAKGEKPEAMEFSEVVAEPQGKYFRYMKALAVQPLCLTCHGAPGDIPEGVKARLAAEYPHDKATGYSAGQIRGAITIKRQIPPSPL